MEPGTIETRTWRWMKIWTDPPDFMPILNHWGTAMLSSNHVQPEQPDARLTSKKSVISARL